MLINHRGKRGRFSLSEAVEWQVARITTALAAYARF